MILLDTGYLFAETYAFVEKLTERLGLNLKVYRSTLSPAWIVPHARPTPLSP